MNEQLIMNIDKKLRPLFIGQKEKDNNIKNSVTFVTFVTLHSLTCLLINLFT